MTNYIKYIFSFFTISVLLLFYTNCSDSGGGELIQDDPPQETFSTVVATEFGDVGGVETENLFIYKGIPFAAAPVGNLRWMPPIEPESWSGTRDATNYGPSCPQLKSSVLPEELKPKEQSEDCLFLNVYVPKNANNLPVSIWIHGGGYTIGTGSADIQDGSNFATQSDSILVTINYRLGPLGFLSHSDLNDESDNDTSGNYGMLDQLQAMKWVKQNISNFGGDPNRVSIFGESAGGGSVCYHLLSPLSKGYFQSAIIQSYNCKGAMRELNGSTPFYPKSGVSLGTQAQEELGCEAATDPLQCMRDVDYQTLLEKIKVKGSFFDGDTEGELYWPIVDNYFIKEQAKDLIESGEFARVPIIGGTTYNESSLWRNSLSIDVNTILKYRTKINNIFRENGPRVLERYPVYFDSHAIFIFERVLTDYTFICPTVKYLSDFSRFSNDVWQYSFDRVHPSGAAVLMGAYHGSEVFYTFNNLDPAGNFSDELEPWDSTLGNAVVNYWAQHARAGNPNHADLEAWPRFDATNQEFLILGDSIMPASGLRKDKCELFDSFN